MNISVFRLGEEEQSWAIADVAGGAGPRCCPQGRDPSGRASLWGSAVPTALPVKVKAVAVIAWWQSLITLRVQIFPKGCDAYENGMIITAILQGAKVNL